MLDSKQAARKYNNNNNINKNKLCPSGVKSESAAKSVPFNTINSALLIVATMYILCTYFAVIFVSNDGITFTKVFTGKNSDVSQNTLIARILIDALNE